MLVPGIFFYPPPPEPAHTLQHLCPQVLTAIVRNKSVGSYAMLPYLTMQANCALWLRYGLTLGDLTLLFPNCVGLLLSSVTLVLLCLCQYSAFAIAASRPTLCAPRQKTVGSKCESAVLGVDHAPINAGYTGVIGAPRDV